MAVSKLKNAQMKLLAVQLLLLLLVVKAAAAAGASCVATVCCLGITATALRLTATDGVTGLPLLLVRCIFDLCSCLFRTKKEKPCSSAPLSDTARRVCVVDVGVSSPQTQQNHDGEDSLLTEGN